LDDHLIKLGSPQFRDRRYTTESVTLKNRDDGHTRQFMALLLIQPSGRPLGNIAKSFQPLGRPPGQVSERLIDKACNLRLLGLGVHHYPQWEVYTIALSIVRTKTQFTSEITHSVRKCMEVGISTSRSNYYKPSPNLQNLFLHKICALRVNFRFNKILEIV